MLTSNQKTRKMEDMRSLLVSDNTKSLRECQGRSGGGKLTREVITASRRGKPKEGYIPQIQRN